MSLRVLAALTDADADGVFDDKDNCLEISNRTQVDADDDGYGNACDADITNDGIVNFADLAIMKKASFKKPGPAAGKP